MTTSGTYNFSMSNGELGIECFDRIGIRAPEITRERLISFRRSLNLELVEWSIKGVNLWAIQPTVIPLIGGTASYNLPATTVDVLDVYRTKLGSPANDITMTPMSRSDYAMQSNKAQVGDPTSFWFNRQSPVPTVTTWPVVQASSTDTLTLYLMRQLQDANVNGVETPDIPFTFYNALIAGATARLAEKFAPDRLAEKQSLASAAYDLAGIQDRERVDLNLTPELGGYYRDC